MSPQGLCIELCDYQLPLPTLLEGCKDLQFHVGNHDNVPWQNRGKGDGHALC